MKYRRRQRWLRRLALGFAFATAMFAGRVSVAAAVTDEGGAGSAQVIPYLSHGILTQEQAQQTASSPAGDEIAFRNALDSQALAWANTVVAAADSLHDPLGAEVGKSIKTRPDDRAVRFTGPEQTPVISYLSHGMGPDGQVGARPDDRADRFSPGDGVPQTRLEVSSSTDWDGVLTFGFGAALVALALGLGLGYLRRPRLAL